MGISYLSPHCEIRASKIHGQGLFAKSSIQAGEIVAVKGGAILTQDEWGALEGELGSAEIQIAESLYIAPTSQTDRESSMLYTNHSCSPNIGIQGQIVFVAMREIEADEELTHDWATTDNEDYSLKCQCGSLECRGQITGKDWMCPELQVRYQGWFAWHIQRAIANQRE